MAAPTSKGTIYDVARAAGVSIGTVSRVFNRKPDVAEITRTEVLRAAKRVRYLPRISARRINIGLMVENIEKASEVGFIGNTVSTLSRDMAAHSALLEFIHADDIEAVYRNYIRGIIAVVFGNDHPELFAIKHIPVVLINNRLPAHNFHTVASDHAQGARLATEHLLRRGHRRIGFMEVRSDNWGAIERERGFRESFQSAQLPIPKQLIKYTERDPAGGPLRSILDAQPTALLVCGEELSLEVNQILLHELRVRIPEDLSVISYETPHVSPLLTPPQTTVAQPWEELGRRAIETVVALITKPKVKHPDVFLPNRLVERASVRSLTP